jgi:zinc/manganese transport system permease protein
MSQFLVSMERPFVACLLLAGILVYLGIHVLSRKVIFVDLALAQIAALGVMWAILMGYDHETDTLPVTLYSLAFTAIGALVFSITRTGHERVPHEALIGIIYVTASAGGLVLADRFALGTEALKELIAGRVALVTPTIVAKLAITCAVVAVVFVVLHRRFMRISRDPAAAEAAGISIRAWDFLFYMLFGMLITQSVSVLGVLPVFAYLVIPAVAGAFLFSSIRARLIFGWAFAGAISLIGLETARLSQLDPGPTIVCLFAGALVVLGVGLFLRARRFAPRAILRVAGGAVLFVGFLGGTLVFRKSSPTASRRADQAAPGDRQLQKVSRRQIALGPAGGRDARRPRSGHPRGRRDPARRGPRPRGSRAARRAAGQGRRVRG